MSRVRKFRNVAELAAMFPSDCMHGALWKPAPGEERNRSQSLVAFCHSTLDFNLKFHSDWIDESLRMAHATPKFKK